MPVTADAAAPDGVFVRASIRTDRWAESLPPAPAGFDVSVSLSSEEVSDLHGAALALLGYRVVAGAPGGGSGGEPAAGFLVSRELVRRRPRWWRALLEHADATYDLAFGPVAMALAGVLRAHRGAGGPGA